MASPEFAQHYFDFDLDRALSEQVIGKLEASPMLPLEKGVAPKESGIYGLYHNGDLVYVGKVSKDTTKSQRSLRDRLNEHVGKVGKRGIPLDEMQCRFLIFDSDWWVVAAEFAIIRHYEPLWNGSGFGSKTPGSGRPGTDRVSRFDQQFPPEDS